MLRSLVSMVKFSQSGVNDPQQEQDGQAALQTDFYSLILCL